MILLMGVAGAGKSVQGQMLAEVTGYKWISTGEIFRAYLPAERLKELSTGKLLGDNEVISVVDQALQSLGNGIQAVLDGFPRTVTQAEWLLNQSKDRRFEIVAAFNLAASRDVVRERLLARGRDDDNEEVIKERFNEYETKTVPILSYLKDNNIKVYEIDANQNTETVHAEMMKYLT